MHAAKAKVESAAAKAPLQQSSFVQYPTRKLQETKTLYGKWLFCHVSFTTLLQDCRDSLYCGEEQVVSYFLGNLRQWVPVLVYSRSDHRTSMNEQVTKQLVSFAALPYADIHQSLIKRHLFCACYGASVSSYIDQS